MSGLNPILNVLTPEEEKELLQWINKQDIKKSTVNDRYLIRYGNSIYPNYIKSKIIPPILIDLSIKLITLGLLDDIPGSVTINIYKPGCYIKPHIDDLRAGPVITILSIESDAEIVLTKGKEEKRILLPSKSVFQLKDEYRTSWTHSIPKVKTERISIVFRQESKSKDK